MIDTKWTCTDPDTGQYGRQISEWEFEFKEGLNGVEKNLIIDIRDYDIDEIEDCILTYGYTLGWKRNGGCRNIYELYGESTKWIICECIFEQEN